jgi:hypothetical protein
MATNAVTATIVVKFEPSSGASFLTAEVDSREDGLNKGKTNFGPGDTVGILVRKSDDLVISTAIATAGTLVSGAGGSTTEEEFIPFAFTLEGNTGKPVGSITDSAWYGNDLGSFSIPSNTTNITLLDPAAKDSVGVLYLNYTSPYLAYYLTAPTQLNGKKTFEILVAFVGTPA